MSNQVARTIGCISLRMEWVMQFKWWKHITFRGWSKKWNFVETCHIIFREKLEGNRHYSKLPRVVQPRKIHYLFVHKDVLFLWYSVSHISHRPFASFSMQWILADPAKEGILGGNLFLRKTVKEWVPGIWRAKFLTQGMCKVCLFSVATSLWPTSSGRKARQFLRNKSNCKLQGIQQ